jgi:uncharacterized protein
MRVIASPCTRLCAIDAETRLCEGCGRTLEEIGNWLNYDDHKRRRIMRELPGRMVKLNQRKHDEVPS